MTDVVEEHRDDLRDIAESDLPAADLASALLEAAETED